MSQVRGQAVLSCRADRVCDLARAHPNEIRRQGHTEVGLAVRAIEALTWSGQEDQALELAESTYRRLAPVEAILEGGRLLRWLGYYRGIYDRTAADAAWREAVLILSPLPATAELSGALRGLGNSDKGSPESEQPAPRVSAGTPTGDRRRGEPAGEEEQRPEPEQPARHRRERQHR